MKHLVSSFEDDSFPLKWIERLWMVPHGMDKQTIDRLHKLTAKNIYILYNVNIYSV